MRMTARGSMLILVLGFATLTFSENTADVDLWGHVLFGYDLLRDGWPPAADPYAWTTSGQPWINHELLAEAALALAHKLAGGTGIFLLMLGLALATFCWALSLGGRGEDPRQPGIALALAFPAIPEIAFGFAARPQMFTALGLVALLALMQAAERGRRRALLLLPPLFAVWINTHGGALAGIALLGAATAINLLRDYRSGLPPLRWPSAPLAVAGLLSVAALFANPWGTGLFFWLIESVSWLRPQIEEWNPTRAGLQHIGHFVLVGIGLAAAWTSRLRRPWEWLVLALLAFAALRSVRHTPLFALAALILLPGHLGSLLDALRDQTEGLRAAWSRPMTQRVACVTPLAATALCAIAFVSPSRRPLLTMAVSSEQYPLSAIAFMREHALAGRMVAFFDWGEIGLWDLPGCSPSLDGRLDTCYPRPLIDEHWKFYRGEPWDVRVFDPTRADLALLPRIPARDVLLQRGWQLVYEDPLACVLVRDPQRHRSLRDLRLPATSGTLPVLRVPFPDAPAEGQVFGFDNCGPAIDRPGSTPRI